MIKIGPIEREFRELRSPKVQLSEITISKKIDEALFDSSGIVKEVQGNHIKTLLGFPVLINPALPRDVIQIVYWKDGILREKRIINVLMEDQ